MKYFVDHYLVAVIFLVIAVYAFLEIRKVKKQRKEQGEEVLPTPAEEETEENSSEEQD